MDWVQVRVRVGSRVADLRARSRMVIGLVSGFTKDH